MVRKELLRTCETKQRSSYITQQTLKHNTWYSNYGLLNLFEGTDRDNRTGEDVYLKALTIKMHFNTFSDRPQVMFRCMLVRVPTDKKGTTTDNLFQWAASAGATNYMLAFPHTDIVTVLAEKFVQIKGDSHWDNIGTLVSKQMATTCVLSYNFKMGQRVKYYDNEPRDFSIRLLVLAYDAHGTLVSDNLATMETMFRLYFKDP